MTAERDSRTNRAAAYAGEMQSRRWRKQNVHLGADLRISAIVHQQFDSGRSAVARGHVHRRQPHSVLHTCVRVGACP